MKINLNDQNKHSLNLSDIRTVLLTGETGTGKSTLAEDIYSQLKSKLTPQELRFLILDMTRIEFIKWKNSPYLLSPVIYKTQDAFEAFEMALNSLDQNKLTVIHIEECDMVIEDQARFEQLWHKANNSDNVLVVFSTSRPANNVLTDHILDDADLKIAFKLSSSEQSKRVLGFAGAEKLKSSREKIITLRN
jgi:DNA segregation ATPase FtsK/SpoIIIE-like protein